jgi:hypothetical protein
MDAVYFLFCIAKLAFIFPPSAEGTFKSEVEI